MTLADINLIDLTEDEVGIVDLGLPPSGRQVFTEWRIPRTIKVLLFVNFVLAALYLGWWFLPGHVGSPVLFAALALAEFFTFLHVLGLWWTVWSTRIAPPPASADRSWTIDVFIPTYGEPLDVLRLTIAAAVRMNVDHRTFVLDDARRPEVERLAWSLGADYLTRADNEGAKAGNLNAALRQVGGELVVVFDADHVPQQEFLERLVGYFADPALAFVQTPQYYVNGLTNRIARGAYQQQAVFYGPICRGKNGLESTFCCGTNVIFRRAALDDVGGFDGSSVVEDFVTSMHLHRKGWRTVFYPYVLAAGLGPTNVSQYFGQQLRWARGSIGALMSGEPFKRGYTLGQRAQYLLATTFYLIGFVTAVYVSLPVLYMLFGWSAFSEGSGSFIFFYGPYMILGLVTLRWGLGRQLRLEHLQFTFGTFPVYALAGLTALLRRKASFNVTSKDEGAVPRPPAVAFVTVGLFVITLVSLGLGLFLRPIDARTVTNLAWGIVNLLLLGPLAWSVAAEGAASSLNRTSIPKERLIVS